MNQKIKYLSFVFLVFLIIEIIAQLILLSFESKKYSIILKPFSNQISKLTTNYIINWDYEKNKMKPGTYITKEGIEYRINSNGFRGKEFNKIKNKKRIITFGGSTTIGLESPDEKTYPSQLEKLLSKNNYNYEVINMGFGSKSINYVKNLFFTEAYKYKPDVIIIYSNRNSLMYDGSFVEPKIINSNYLIKSNYFLQDNIMTYRLMFKIYKRLINLNLKSGYVRSPISSKGVSENYLKYGYTDSLKEIIEFSEKNYIKVILVKQAYYFKENIFGFIEKYNNSELLEKYKQGFFKKNFNLDEEVIFWSLMGSILNRNLDNLKIYNNVVVVDPILNLVKEEDNFTDYLHLTPKGNFVLANEILNQGLSIFENK